MINSIAAFALGVSLMIAPHTLALLGNVAGMQQELFPVWLAVAAVLYWINAQSIAEFYHRRSVHSPATQHVVGGLSWSSRWMTTIMLSTVLLVTAGFAFNETFLYWFPNFAFAFILLAALTIVHLLGQKATRFTQMMLVAIVLVGLSTLSIMGLWQNISDQPGGAAHRLVPHTPLLPTVALIFIGFDLVLDHGFKNKANHADKLMIWIIMIMSVVLGTWGWISLQVVPAEKLSTSFIPHIIAARSIGGETGRMIMGAIVIAGSAAAISALLSSISRTSLYTAGRQTDRKPSWLHWLNHPSSKTIIAAIAIGWMMAIGMAGTEVIDSYTRAGLIVWLLYYGAIHLSLLAFGRASRRTTSDIWWGWLLFRPFFGAAAMIGCSFALMLTDVNRASVLYFVLIVPTLVTLALWANRRWVVVNRNERNHRDHRPFRVNR